jgi:hypothetical protein
MSFEEAKVTERPSRYDSEPRIRRPSSVKSPSQDGDPALHAGIPVRNSLPLPRSSDGYHQCTWRQYPKGYPRFAAFIANDEDKSTTIYRRFERLAARNILFLESELAELEYKQDRLDYEIFLEAELSRDIALSSVSWEELQSQASYDWEEDLKALKESLAQESGFVESKNPYLETEHRLPASMLGDTWVRLYAAIDRARELRINNLGSLERFLAEATQKCHDPNQEAKDIVASVTRKMQLKCAAEERRQVALEIRCTLEKYCIEPRGENLKVKTFELMTYQIPP